MGGRRPGIIRSFGAALSLAAAGCCSTEPDGLTSADPAERDRLTPDERRERLACIAEAALEDGDPALVRLATDVALASLDPAVEEQAAVRAAAHRVLSHLRPATAAGAASVRLAPGAEQDPSPWARAAAVDALGAVGGAVALEALRLAVVQDPGLEVRIAAARELAELDDDAPATTDALLGALRDEAGAVRSNARRALRMIHAADLGLDPQAWREWMRARGPLGEAQEPEPEPEAFEPEPAPRYEEEEDAPPRGEAPPPSADDDAPR